MSNRRGDPFGDAPVRLHPLASRKAHRNGCQDKPNMERKVSDDGPMRDISQMAYIELSFLRLFESSKSSSSVIITSETFSHHHHPRTQNRSNHPRTSCIQAILNLGFRRTRPKPIRFDRSPSSLGPAVFIPSEISDIPQQTQCRPLWRNA